MSSFLKAENMDTERLAVCFIVKPILQEAVGGLTEGDLLCVRFSKYTHDESGC